MPKAPYIALLIGLMVPSSAIAASTGDVFADQGFYAYERPLSLQNDRFFRNDMFGHSESYVRTDKDMFDNDRPPPDYGVEDLFRAHLNTIPDQPLFHWPRNQPYP